VQTGGQAAATTTAGGGGAPSEMAGMNVFDRALAGTSYTKTDVQLIAQLASLAILAYWVGVIEG